MTHVQTLAWELLLGIGQSAAHLRWNYARGRDARCLLGSEDSESVFGCEGVQAQTVRHSLTSEGPLLALNNKLSSNKWTPCPLPSQTQPRGVREAPSLPNRPKVILS